MDACPRRGRAHRAHAASVRGQGAAGRRTRTFRARGRSRCSADQAVTIEADRGPIEILLLQGRPIGEPVAQYGPFVMNTAPSWSRRSTDYRRTQFGGWPFPDNAPVHPREQGRFAKHADGRVESVPGHEEHEVLATKDTKITKRNT